ncbi:MAG: hypothetical protein ACRDID_14690 [Ktedonobacterales bacterium]
MWHSLTVRRPIPAMRVSDRAALAQASCLNSLNTTQGEQAWLVGYSPSPTVCILDQLP